MAPRSSFHPTATRARCSPAGWWTRKNPWFARNIVNRAWFWLLGRGIIQEPDDIRPDNPPVNPELLAYLEKEFVASHYDMKHLYRLILNSQAYQLSSIPRSTNPEAAANFAFYPVRQLDAEVLSDALCEITGTTEKYSSSIPEPFTFIPEKERSIALPDGSITSSFLEMFGRPPRDTGLESERNNLPTANQRLHLLNSSHIQRKIEQARNSSTCSRPATIRATWSRDFTWRFSRGFRRRTNSRLRSGISGRWCGQPGGGAGRRVGLDQQHGICVPALKRTVHENKPSICCFGGASVPRAGSSAASPHLN